MNAQDLLNHYARISEGPDAIPKLRRFVLDLAVRGKLVEQDSTDEPASELLKRITAKKANIGSKLKSDNNDVTDIPFAVPRGWALSSIGEICSKTGSGSTPRGGKEVYTDNGVPFLRSQNVYDDGLRLDDVAYITAEIHERMSGTAVQPADLLLNITGGSMGRCCRI
jgi:type I restriction enzyme S subunit